MFRYDDVLLDVVCEFCGYVPEDPYFFERPGTVRCPCCDSRPLDEPEEE